MTRNTWCVAIVAARSGRAISAANVVKGVENVLARTGLVGSRTRGSQNLTEFSDTFMCKGFVDTPAFATHNCTYMHAVREDILWNGTDNKRDLRPQSDSTQSALYDPGEGRQGRGVRENCSALDECKSSEREGKYGTHVSHGYGEKTQKYR